MNRRLGVALGIAVNSVALTGFVVCAQESRAQTWQVLLTPWGHPDLQGIWTTDAEIGVPVERPEQYGESALLTDQEFEEKLQGQIERAGERRATAAGRTSPDLEQWYGKTGNGSRRTSLVVDPPDGRIPEYTVEATQRVVPKGTELGFVGGSFTDGPFDGPEDLNLFDRCITRGLPTTWYPSQYSNGFQIVQSEDHVALLYERLHEARIIPLDGRPHLDPSARRWMGDSRGRWEGQTLVVEVTNFNDQRTFMKSGRTLRLTERYTRVDSDTLTVSVTIDDPTTWVRPWTFMVTGKKDPSYWQIFEGACHEGNYSMRHILSGARAKEQAEAAAAKQKEGRRLFQQKCAVCHLSILPRDGSGAPYAGRLGRSLVDGDEDNVRRVIADGAGARMPGWKYTLRADQIDALISYLRTIETPSRTVGAKPSEF